MSIKIKRCNVKKKKEPDQVQEKRRHHGDPLIRRPVRGKPPSGERFFLMAGLPGGEIRLSVGCGFKKTWRLKNKMIIT